MNKKFTFEKLPWETTGPGARHKTIQAEDKRIRLVRFEDSFVEQDWCLKGHTGYVLDGKMKIDFNGALQHYKKGDGFHIPPGETNKHKVILEKNEWVELFIIENIID